MSRPSDFDDGPRTFDPNATARVKSPDLGITGWLRWFWRQLTSMRVALLLLLMLAIAAIPGSLFPQRSADPNGVIQWEESNPELFAILDSFPIQLFDVYASAWFSAIYLLLFISLIGCVLPRIIHHWRALRGAPPKTPVRLSRMAGFSELQVTNRTANSEERQKFAEHTIAEAATILKSQRYRALIERRVVRGVNEVSVSAERGYLRETGNLVVHLGLVGVLVGVAIGGAFSFYGQKVLIEGETGMANALIDYDSVTSGTYFDEASLVPWGIKLDDLEVHFVTPDDGNRHAIGQVLEHEAFVTVFPADGSEPQKDLVLVNKPMRYAGSNIYLLANGYAPTITVRSPSGEVVFSESVPFIPQDSNFTSLGVVKVPDGLETQLGLRGFFYPTQALLDTGAYTSNYPDLENPILTLDVFEGDLGINEGIPQSVYSLDTSNMEQRTGRDTDVESLELTIGETVDLPNEAGTVTFDAAPRYAAFDVVIHPTQVWILVFAITATAGLLTSLFVPRRRVWVKAIPSATGVTLQYAALSRGDDPTLEHAVADLLKSHRERI